MSISYQDFQTFESAVLLHDLLEDASQHEIHFRRLLLSTVRRIESNGKTTRFATSVAFSISYGCRITDINTQIVKDNQLAAMGSSSCLLYRRCSNVSPLPSVREHPVRPICIPCLVAEIYNHCQNPRSIHRRVRKSCR